MSHPMDHNALYYCCGTWRYKSGGWHDCLGLKQGTKANDTKQVLVEIRATEIAEMSAIITDVLTGDRRPSVEHLRYAKVLSSDEYNGWLDAVSGAPSPSLERPDRLAGWLAWQIASTP